MSKRALRNKIGEISTTSKELGEPFGPHYSTINRFVKTSEI